MIPIQRRRRRRRRLITVWTKEASDSRQRLYESRGDSHASYAAEGLRRGEEDNKKKKKKRERAKIELMNSDRVSLLFFFFFVSECCALVFGALLGVSTHTAVARLPLTRPLF